MPINPHNRGRFTRDFHRTDRPDVRIRAYLNEPPEESRFGAIPAWLLQVPKAVVDPELLGKALRLTSDPTRIFLLADFKKTAEGITYRAYETNRELTWITRETELDPITLMRKDKAVDILELIPVFITQDFKAVNQDKNPNLTFHIITTAPIKPQDRLSGYKITQVYLQDGLYNLKAELIKGTG